MTAGLPKHSRRWAWWAVAALFGVLAWRQHALVDRYAVNMIYWDQWDFYRPVFQEQGLWAVFTQQHGPHREGLGLLLMQGLDKMSAWNERWDALAASLVVMAAALAALPLLRRLGSRSAFALAAVPLVFFNRHQFESFIGSTNLSHGVVPVLLLVLYGYAWFLPRAGWRLATVSVLNFFLIFTGFGMFAGLLTPVLTAAETVQAWRGQDRKRAAFATMACLAGLISWGLFLHGYAYWPMPRAQHAYDYALFACFMMASFFGVTGAGGAAFAVGLAVIVFLGTIAVVHGWRCLRSGIAEHPDSVTLFSLASFGLLYCAATAFGRVYLGLERAPEASRYITLTIPAGFVIAAQCSRIKSSPWASGLCAVYVALLLAGTTWLRPEEMESVRGYSDGRRNWKEAYLATLDETQADARSHFRIYPGPVTQRLTYLRVHHLNLFAEP